MAQISLWGQEFLPSADNKKDKIINKVNNPKKVKTVTQTLKSKTVSIEDKLAIIEENVYRILGGYKDNTVVIKSREELHNYIDTAIDNGIIAIDTETNNSLDPLTCLLMGVCIYTPSMKNAYIPVNHIDRNSSIRLEWQVTEQDIKEEFDRLEDTKIIMHNCKFDYQVIHCTCNCDLNIYWDTLIGSKLLDENERAGLKQQYIDKIDSSIEKYSIDHLFDIEYAILDPELFALYAATDAYMTYKLYEWQLKAFLKDEKLFDLFLNVEMKVAPVVASMELEGIALDTEYCKRLSKKYNQIEEKLEKQIEDELVSIKPQINSWRLSKEANFRPVNKKNKTGYSKSKAEQLKDPPETTSPTQLAILLYDILKVPVVDKKNPRGTGEEVLKKIQIPLTELILEQRTILKMLKAFIDTLPEELSTRDNRIHASFNQLGTDTGRFSCSKPNLQQIPSKNKEIRMMFCARPGYKLVGADYSQQEPRLLTAYSKEPKLIEAYSKGKDMYAVIGTGVFHNNYEDNLEFLPDGSKYSEGAARRKKCKTLLLGMMYGMGSKSLAEKMDVSIEEAKQIIDNFYSGFPKVQQWIHETEEKALETGYVEDFWGRKRHLPDLFLPEYEFVISANKEEFNPLLGTKGIKYDESLIEKYKAKLASMKRFTEYEQIKKQAHLEGLEITNNGGFISRSKRQCVNARIQGGAATMTKKAMIAIFDDELMKEYGFKLLIGVHDELIGEVPEENVELAAGRLSYLMKNCVKELSVPFKCDTTIEINWYEEEYAADILKEYLMSKSLSDVCNNHPECTEEQIKKYINM